MENPELVVLVADVWKKVATNVTTGFVYIKDTKPNVYVQTFRKTGESGTSTEFNAEEVTIPMPGLPISFTAAADIYIKSKGAAGLLRVDV